VDEFNNHEKIVQHVVDMEELEEKALPLVQGHDVAFSMLGVGKISRTPTEEVIKVELGYVGAFARACKKGGIKRFQVFTMAGADPKSFFSPVSIIGEKEELLKNIGFQHLSIFRPSTILGNSNTPAILDVIFPVVSYVLPSAYKGIHEKDLARAMLLDWETNPTVDNDPPKVKILEYSEMMALIENSTK